MQPLGRRIRSVRRETPAVYWILVALGCCFVLQLLFRLLETGVPPEAVLGLSRADLVAHFAWYQPVTYMFLHDTEGLWHLLFNALVIGSFGRELERVMGRNRFLLYYGTAGVAGGLVHVLFSPAGVIGASAAVFALLAAAALYWPERRVLLLFFIPVKMKVLVFILAGMEVLFTFLPSGVSHYAHLGGLGAGLVLLGFFRRTALRGKISEYNRERQRRNKEMLLAQRSADGRRIDLLLDKISATGLASLRRRERRFLDRASRRIAAQEPPRTTIVEPLPPASRGE